MHSFFIIFSGMKLRPYVQIDQIISCLQTILFFSRILHKVLMRLLKEDSIRRGWNPSYRFLHRCCRSHRVDLDNGSTVVHPSTKYTSPALASCRGVVSPASTWGFRLLSPLATELHRLGRDCRFRMGAGVQTLDQWCGAPFT